MVGVVGDYKVETVGEPPTPYIHYPIAQRDFTGNVLIARTATDPARAARRRCAAKCWRSSRTPSFSTTRRWRRRWTRRCCRRAWRAQTIGLVGLVATLLAAVGLYGVVAYAVGRRTREIGIRMALGAAPGDVLKMVMGQGLGLAAAGIAIGLALVVGRGAGDRRPRCTASAPPIRRVGRGGRRPARLRRAGQLPARAPRRAGGAVDGAADVVAGGAAPQLRNP